MRKTWDEYFISFIDTIAERATCNRGKSGALIVKDKRILSTGYVGAPEGLQHCDDVGHLLEHRKNDDGLETSHCIRTTHAEMNAIAQAAKNGVSINGATLYCRMTPCRDCVKLLITAGIKRVVTQKKYQAADLTVKWLQEAGVELITLSDEIQQYQKQKV